MSSLVARLGGALLIHGGRSFLVGEPKRPIDWESEGFLTPSHTLEAVSSELRPWFPLTTGLPSSQLPAMTRGPVLSLPGSADEDLCEVLYERFAIRRNGSISERLWDLVLENTPPDGDGVRDARWLVALPVSVWEIVRDSLLRCA